MNRRTLLRSTFASLLLGPAALAAAAGEKAAPATAPSPAGDAPPAPERDGLPLVFHEDFKDPDKALARFEMIDPGDWKKAKDADGRSVLSLFKRPTEASAGKPAVRSPFGRAMIKDLYVSEFVMRVKLKSTIKAYPHQDLCLHFGERDATHLYYVHFGRAPDPNAGNIFIVDGAPRKNLLPPHKKETDWSEHYHTVAVGRKADGTISTFFDDAPYLSVKDETFPSGRVGVGSFDDTGDFAEVTVWGKKVERPAK
ncbi:MAG: alpha/beta hydrolase fold protein [Phycisphaerales bacterium]|nr:alpha/beta hydrolase fold protein [Phycisphaerales bacterium]